MTDQPDQEASISEPVYEPEQESRIEFRGRSLLTATLANNQGYVALSSLAEAFGLSRTSMLNRLRRRDDYFGAYTCKIRLMTAGGPQAMLCMDATAVPLFLSGTTLDAAQDDEAREVLKAFLRECQTVLAEHFGISEQGEMNFMRETLSRLVYEREAEDQGLEGRAKRKYVDDRIAEVQQAHEEKVGQIRQAFGELRSIVSDLGGSPDRLTPEQAHQVSATVRTLGYILQKRGVNNPYQGIYNTIFRMVGVGTTERIRRRDFEQVMQFLERQIEILSDAPRLLDDEERSILDMLDK